MNDKKVLKAFKKIKKYCKTTTCDLCIFNLGYSCYFEECNKPHKWDVLHIEFKELDKREQEVWGGEGD